MSKLVVYFLCIVILLALNVVFPRIHLSAPNFLFLLVIVYAFRKDNPDYLWIAFFSGLLLDLYTNTFFGTYTLSFLIIAAIINYTTRTSFKADPSTFYFATVTTVSNLLLIGLIFIFGEIGSRLVLSFNPISTIYLGEKIWLDLALNLLFVAPVYFITDLNERIIDHYASKNARLV